MHSSAQTQVSLMSLDRDVIKTHILADLEPGYLLNYVLASKETYSKRDQYIKANKYTQGYEGDYFADLMNSHITGFKSGSLIMQVPSTRLNPVFISNTYKLIVHSHNQGYQFPLNYYFQDLIKAEFGYDKSEICEQHLAKMCAQKWWNTNVNIYEVYKVIYHLTKIKHRNLGEALETFTFINADKFDMVHLKNTLVLIGDVYNPEHPNAIALRSLMFYLIYCYMDFLEPLMVDPIELDALSASVPNSTTKYVALASAFYNKNEDIIKKLTEIKDLPDFIKNRMNKKYMQLFKKFDDMMMSVSVSVT